MQLKRPMYVLSKAQALDHVRERSDLFDHAGLANPFACSAWVLNFIEQVADDGWTFVVPEYALGERQSLMLLCHDLDAARRCKAATNYYASLFSPLISSVVSDGDRRDVAEQLVGQLAGSKPRCAVVNLAPLDVEAADTSAVQQAFTRRGWYVRRYFCFGNWYLPCAGVSFDDYMKGRDSRLQNTWARKAKKFRAGTAGGGRLEIVTEPAQVDAAMDAYERIYARSWKNPEPYPGFVRSWAAVCARHGWLRLGLAWAGDVPIAAQFWFTMNRRAYIFKLAYAEEYANWSAGTVLSAHLFRRAMDEDKVVEIDYLTGDDPYKQSWMTERRERIGLIACDLRTPRGLVTAAGELAGEITRRWRVRAQPNAPRAEPAAAQAEA